MIIPTAQNQLLVGKLRDLLECAEALSKLNKTNVDKDTDLARLRTNSNNARNCLHGINNDIQTLEKENMRLNEEIQSYLDRQNTEERRVHHTLLANVHFFLSGTAMMNDSVNKQLETCRIEMTTIAKVLGLDLDRISLSENNLMITFPDSQHTTLVFEESQGELKLLSISPPQPNFGIIQEHLQRTGDFVGLIISLYKRLH